MVQHRLDGHACGELPTRAERRELGAWLKTSFATVTVKAGTGEKGKVESSLGKVGTEGADSHLAQAYFYQGDVSKAIAIARDLSGEASASASTRGRAALASFLASLGEKKEAMAHLQPLLESQYLDHHAAYSIGAAYAQLGDSPKAMQWLRRSASSGLPCYPLYQNDKLLDPLRQTTDFQEFLEQLRLDMNARRATQVK